MNKRRDNWKERSEFWTHQEQQRHHLLRTQKQIHAAAEANSLATSRHIYHPPPGKGGGGLRTSKSCFIALLFNDSSWYKTL